MNKRSTTFDAFRAARKDSRLADIGSAIKLLGNASYSNLTNFSKDVAKLVHEFEVRRNDLKPESERIASLRKVSHVTILRNPAYRQLLEDAFGSKCGDVEPSKSGISDIEAYKIRVANLEFQNGLLKDRIRSIDLQGIESTLCPIDEQAETALKQCALDIRFLIRVLDDAVTQLSKAYTTVLPGDESESRPEAGFYGPFALIATYEEMIHLQRLRDLYLKMNSK